MAKRIALASRKVGRATTEMREGAAAGTPAAANGFHEARKLGAGTPKPTRRPLMPR